MKKILFSLIALVCSMSMNAQVMKIFKGGELVKTYTAEEADSVAFEEEPAAITGTAKRTGDIEVTWVQLWDKGPKFAEYNVGAANNKAEDYGGYYSWGKTIDKDANRAYNEGTDVLTGTDDTATNLWGENWRMPTNEEFKALFANCDFEWTTVNDVNGLKFSGKDDYASNSVFFPAAGRWNGGLGNQGTAGSYWSSTPIKSGNNAANGMYFTSSSYLVPAGNSRFFGFCVRPVLAE